MASRNRTKEKASVAAVEDAEMPQAEPGAFPVVGVGASAGGLEAFSDLLRALPEKPGFALIFVQHQEPRHASMLTEILARTSTMQVIEVAGGEQIERDTLYVAPSHSQVLVDRGHLRMRADGAPLSMPIDALFTSLAADQGNRAIGVILSGAASDGSLGSRAIKAEGGITFAQDESAKVEGMPRSAVAGGTVDFVLPPSEIAQELVRIARQAHVIARNGPRSLPEPEIVRLFSLLRKAHDIDFTHYKQNTIERRVRRRMAIARADNLPAYIAYVRENPDEIEQLYRDLLIHVTSFFRDNEVFEVLKRDILPSILSDRGNANPVRVWVPGCATGEEVYTIAIALLEAQSALNVNATIQIFGTDISETVIEFARAAVYPASALADVPPDRLARFFTKSGDTYRVSSAVRDCCIFARQNLTNDPPFSKLDLISCRNVMIYLGAVLQRRVVSLFHYALRPGGYLLLGSSETIGSFPDVFTLVDRKHKIYQKKMIAVRLPFGIERSPARDVAERPRIDEPGSAVTSLFREADRAILARFAPVGVIINENLDVLQFRGRTGAFLEPPSGTASLNVLKMAREGLLGDLRAAIAAARKTNEPVRRTNVRVKNNGGSIVANIDVIPFPTPAKETLMIVVFEEAAAEKKVPVVRGKKGKGKQPPAEDGRQVVRLNRELEATREYLQSIIEEQEAINEELRSANEEIQSSNEELQSTNEELETAKEELQSSNEELTTLNEELENRNEELARVNNDLINLLNGVEIPIIMLDNALRIRRFNPGAQRALNLIAGDVGRPIDDMKTTLLVDNIGELVSRVIETLETSEREVQDRKGHWYSLRIRPYKTVDNKIDGAVLVLVDLRKPTAA